MHLDFDLLGLPDCTSGLPSTALSSFAGLVSVVPHSREKGPGIQEAMQG